MMRLPRARRGSVLRAAGLVGIAAILLSHVPQTSGTTAHEEWPAITPEMKPWTRWWWMGSAVDPVQITAELEAFRGVGLGGVEITPIYGVRGEEARFITYLSPAWTDRLEHTLREARRLELGVDMATGTGWPFGGPWVGAEDASHNIVVRTYTARAGERLRETIRVTQEPLVRTVGGHRVQLIEPIELNHDLQALAVDQVRFAKPLLLQTLMAYSDTGGVEDLTRRVGADGTLDWTAPAGTWTLYALFQGWHGKLVERAAPGGEGNVIDHFALPPIRKYLSRFDTAFAGRSVGGIRAFFNDSYEVDDASGQADWTPALLDEFHRRRGYDLRRHLTALVGRDTDDRNARVLADYRETISDLLLDTFTTTWREWAHRRGSTVRNQAHGSPGSLLDLYAASDIPETEGVEMMRIKWASSAAHVAGRRLASAEAATWLGEHFRSTLADVRAAVDRYFLGGINHIVYHGTNYSPPNEPWPGWLFYAAVHFNPRNPWWTDFAALNQYVTRVQSFLQAGSPDNDVLLYFPLYDAFATRSERGLLEHFGGPQPPLRGSPFESVAELLVRRGYGMDFISDRQLQNVRVASGALSTGGSTYRVLMLPASRYIPLATFERVVGLAREGATVLFFDGLPADVAGLHDLEARRARFRHLTGALRFGPEQNGIRETRPGRGRVFAGGDIDTLLASAAVPREVMVDSGLQFVRRRHSAGRYYFVANQGRSALDGWVRLASRDTGVVLFDPMSGRRGTASTRRSDSGLDVYVHLDPGESLILATHSSAVSGDAFSTFSPAGPAQSIGGPWMVHFVSGGPQLPEAASIDRLASWTTLNGEEVRRFSGTARYTTRFPRPAAAAGAWRLDLGEVRHSARVRLNGRDLGTLIGPTFAVTINDQVLAAENQLEVHVTNLMANRIADLDRRRIPWKKFYNINFPARLPENRGPDGLFTAAGWAPLDSGLLGPVTLTPLAARKP
jgi:hypothetical protein